MNVVSLQDRISPPAPAISQKISDAKVSGETGVVDSNGGATKVDFQSVLLNANDNLQKERQAVSGGDLSSAKNYEDFLEKLSANKNSDRVPKNTLDKDDFLKLFVTQLQNQDPLKPQDGAEMASQLAQFNSVEQMMNVNKGLERLEQAQNASQSINYMNYIGKDVVVNGGRVKFDHTGIGDVTFSTEHPVTTSNLEVRDSAGKIVATKNLGNIPQGSHKLQWEGLSKDGEKLPSGNYSFTITAADANGVNVPVEISSKVKVTGVDMAADKASFYTSLGKLKFEDIAAIGEKDFVAPANSGKSANGEQPSSGKTAGSALPGEGAPNSPAGATPAKPGEQQQENLAQPAKAQESAKAPASDKSAQAEPDRAGASPSRSPADPTYLGPVGFNPAGEPFPGQIPPPAKS
jgi:flagellar basal-body rod modification protein FlgD